MEWSDIRIFLAVARHGTLGGAARALHLSHPTVGRVCALWKMPPGRSCSKRRPTVSS